MKKFLSLVAISSMLFACTELPMQTANYAVVPLPNQIEMNNEASPFIMTKRTKIVCADDSLMNEAEFLQEYIEKMTGQKLQIDNKNADANNAIVLSANLSAKNPEAYALNIDKDRIIIDGATAAGTFYGVQTLRKSIPEQLLPSDVSFPAAIINDAPRFAYRGAHLDVVRHFFPADSVKAFIDMIALHNINKMHWHLTDDQGWRIEILKYPNLTELGSVRPGTQVGIDPESNDSIPHGGFFTQAEAKDIVEYAAKRHITVIPEIDLPGHMLGALKAYPQLGCTGGPYELWQRWGISKDVLCAGNDSIYTFLDGVINEICDIFPSEYIHIGGDECPKVRWQECPKCQAKIKALGLKTDKNSTAEQKLQSYVMSHVGKTLTSRGRRAIGWDEILEGGADQGTIIMSWRGINAARKAAEQGLDAILTPTHYCYFDYMQSDPTDEIVLPYATYLPVDTVYALEPVSPLLTPEQAKHILGAQANTWTEFIPTYNYLEYKVLPRLAAMSEVQWTQPENKNIDDFKKRLRQLANTYDSEGYNYAKFVFQTDSIQ